MQHSASIIAGERYNSDESMQKTGNPNEARHSDHYRGRPRRAYCGHRVATALGDQANSDRGQPCDRWHLADRMLQGQSYGYWRTSVLLEIGPSDAVVARFDACRGRVRLHGPTSPPGPATRCSGDGFGAKSSNSRSGQAGAPTQEPHLLSTPLLRLPHSPVRWHAEEHGRGPN